MEYSELESNRVPSRILLMDGIGVAPPTSDLHLVPVDVNADSLPDLIETDPSTTTNPYPGYGPEPDIRRLLYTFNGVWYERHKMSIGSTAVLTNFGFSVTGDFSADGRLGLLWSRRIGTSESSYSSGMYVFQPDPNSTGDWNFSPWPVEGLWMHRLMLVGDVNGDGLPDLIDYGDANCKSGGDSDFCDHDKYNNFVPNSSRDPDWDKRADISTAFSSHYRWVKPNGAGTAFHKQPSCKGPSWAEMDGDWDGGARSVQMADMDGDSLADIVVVGRTQVWYWPSNGRGDYTACRGTNCSCSTPTSSALHSSFMPIDLGPDPDPSRIRVADVNGDGYADLISWDKDGIRVFFNNDGWFFQPPILIAGVWFDTDWAQAVSQNAVQMYFADMNQNGVIDLVVVIHNNIKSLDLHRITNVAPALAPDAWAPRPGLLVRIDNGLGLKHSLAYTTTAELARSALSLGNPWQESLPQTMQVIQKITTETSAPNAMPVRTHYDYSDPAWDGWQRRFRGFRKVVVTRAGDTPITSTQRFYFPPCPDAFCGSQDPTFSRQNAAAGVPLVTEISDAHDRYLSTVSRSYTVVDVAIGLDGNAVRFAYASQVDSRLYDTNDWEPSDGKAEQDISVTVEQERIKLWSGQVGIRGKRNVLVRSNYEQDSYGNIVKSVAHGRVKDDGSAIDNAVVTTVTTRPPRPDWRFLPKSKETSGFPARIGVPKDENRVLVFDEDSAGRPSAVHAILTGTLPLDRRHEDATANIASPPPSASYDSVVRLARYYYDEFDNLIRVSTQSDCTEFTYESNYRDLIVESVRSGTKCGTDARQTTYAWDRGFHTLTHTTAENGSSSQVAYDSFGRPASQSLPNPITGDAEVVPSLSFRYFDPVAGSPQRIQLERATDVGQTRVTWMYLDGLGRPFATLSQADKSAGDGGRWIASGLPRLSAEGLVTGYYEPWFSDADPKLPPQLPLGAKPAAVDLDSFGRASRIERTDGSVVLTYTYRPLGVETEDSAGRWSSARLDGHGRLIQSVRKDGADQLRVSMSYQVSGEIARVVQSPPASAIGSSPVVRWMQYDSLGQLVLNAEPNTSVGFSDYQPMASLTEAWRYAYDFAGRLVGTSDARGCGINISYDSLGRISDEDWSPCKRTHAPYSAPNLATGQGFEVSYRYDTPEPGQTGDFGVSVANLRGRLVSVRDRAAHTRWAYDGRGRVIGIARRLARPADSTGVWPLQSSGDLYDVSWLRSQIAYDAVDRPVRASTGASASELMDSAGVSELTLHYSSRGVLNQVSGSYGALLAGTTHDASGRISSSTLGDVASTMATFGYDAAGVPQSVLVSRTAPMLWVNGAAGYTPPSAGDPPSTQQVLEDLVYGVDASGKIYSIADNRVPALWPIGAKPVSRTFKHDALGRLFRVDYAYPVGLDAVVPEAPGAEIPVGANAPRPVFQTFEFDWLGNLQTTTDDYGLFYERMLGLAQFGTSDAGPNQLTSAGAGRITAVHDEIGNLVDLTVVRATCLDAAGLCTHRYVYDWDEVGELVRGRRWDYQQIPAGEPSFPASPASKAIADLRFRYDARGSRVLRSTLLADGTQSHSAWPLPTLHLYGAGFDSISGQYERTASTEEVQLFGLGRVVHAPTAPGPSPHVLFELRDHLGSTTSVVDKSTSELVERRSYYPTGGRESGFKPPRWVGLTAHSGFSGKEADSQLGLAYFGARYYHASLGRWASADPLTVHRSASDLNPYSYVSGDVLHAVDPNGLQACIGAEICAGGSDLPMGSAGPVGGGGSLGPVDLLKGLFGGGGSRPAARLPDPVAPTGGASKPFDPSVNMSGVQRWIWGGSGTIHDIVTSDQNWKAVEYFYGGIAITALTIATAGVALDLAEGIAGAGALGEGAGAGALGEGAGAGALSGRADLLPVVATLQASGSLDPAERAVGMELQAATPAMAAEAQWLTARLAQLQSGMHPSAAYGGRTLGILRTNNYDIVGSGVRDLSPALRGLTTEYEVAAKLFGAHAEPTLMVNADRLMRIFPGAFIPRILVTTVNICPQCALLIQSSGGLLISPRAAIWPH
jgi:RHS repeat-associated protein